MIGSPKWFKRRKYGGWGLTPKTWQGWVYVFVFLIIIAIGNIIFVDNVRAITYYTLVWIVILIVDVIDIMSRLDKDERERMHEALAERNALWGMIAVITAGLLYDVWTNALIGKFYVNPFIAGALIVGVLIKTASNIYYDKKD